MGHSRSLLVLLFLTLVAGCSSSWQPPPPPPPWPPVAVEPDPSANPIAVGTDASALRPLADQQRERLRAIIDLAEQRELHERGPRLLKTAKEESRQLDRLDGRIDEAMRMGAGDAELDDLHDQLRRVSTRLDRLADQLR